MLLGIANFEGHICFEMIKKKDQAVGFTVTIASGYCAGKITETKFRFP